MALVSKSDSATRLFGDRLFDATAPEFENQKVKTNFEH